MKNLIYLSLLASLFFACKKDDTKDLIGNYSGSFRTLVNGKLVMSDFDVSLQSKQFKVTKGDKKGSGSYQRSKTSELSFTDQNMWTADFNWNVLLNGTYTTEVKGDSLILTKYPPSGPLALPEYNYYQYRLKRIN
ncbi:hypothetical protein [Pedobacter sp. Hv1]|uniref:hypothetical protein n=1 Tax=Pedobacter sp. Hv1 TaxID=1740090 RepID=UPI0006D8925D|nr:hypothetical protein [Pedobacter sp. Hv1]KQC01951.1 hypothetical protein AQF98_06190 [Pedobacter sp. Hv1]